MHRHKPRLEKGRKMKLKAFASGLLLQAEMHGDWSTVSGIDLVHNGNNGTYTVYPFVDDSPSRTL